MVQHRPVRSTCAVPAPCRKRSDTVDDLEPPELSQVDLTQAPAAQQLPRPNFIGEAGAAPLPERISCCSLSRGRAGLAGDGSARQAAGIAADTAAGEAAGQRRQVHVLCWHRKQLCKLAFNPRMGIAGQTGLFQAKMRF